MTGGFLFKLTTLRLEYEFRVRRKIMRIVGDSAAGKSELVRELSNARNPKSGVNVNCKYSCMVLTDSFFQQIKEDIFNMCQKIKNHDSQAFADAMRGLLARNDNILFFADEDFSDMGTGEFALFCKFTDSFFVLFCRDTLDKLPYSYTEIYTIRKSGKFHFLVQKYSPEDFLKFYENMGVIVEDSGAGYQFFNYFYDNVVSAEVKSKISKLLINSNSEIVADGAAFGCEMEKVVGKILRENLDIKLFLPESFEYLLLASRMFNNNIDANEIEGFEHKITGLYFSWESYFTELLIKYTQGFSNNYSKSWLNDCYCKPCCVKKNSRCNIVVSKKKKEAVLGKYLEHRDEVQKTENMSIF